MGRKDKDSTPQICLSGLSIQKSHAIFTSAEQKCVIKPGVVGAKTKVLHLQTSQYRWNSNTTGGIGSSRGVLRGHTPAVF